MKRARSPPDPSNCPQQRTANPSPTQSSTRVETCSTYSLSNTPIRFPNAVTKTVTYDRIVAAGDIVNVTVGDVEIPMSNA